jgi:hypothetical protein
MKAKTVYLRMKFNRNWNEWIIAVYINGKYNEMQSYYTDDKEDAIGTMFQMKKQYANQGFIII